MPASLPVIVKDPRLHMILLWFDELKPDMGEIKVGLRGYKGKRKGIYL